MNGFSKVFSEQLKLYSAPADSNCATALKAHGAPGLHSALAIGSKAK